MAKKMYKKSDLRYEGGYLVTKDDKIVLLPFAIASKLMELEERLQKALWLKNKPEVELPEYGEFVRKSEFDVKLPQIKVETPTIDKAVEFALKYKEDLDNQLTADAANKFISGYTQVFQFVNSDLFVEGDYDTRLDLPTLGNPLELTEDKIMQLVVDML